MKFLLRPNRFEIALFAVGVVLLVAGFVADAAKGADYGFHYGHRGSHFDYHRGYHHHHHYCPPHYGYYYQPYYGYGWREYQPPCPPRYPQRPPGYWDDFRRPRYYGFYYAP